MEVKVLDSIMHGVLKPWKIDTTNTRRFTELVKAAKAASPKPMQSCFRNSQHCWLIIRHFKK
jgi:hypothetical protein